MRRKATNVSIDVSLLEEARSLSVNVSKAAEDGLARAIGTAREAQWRAENADAIDAANRYVEENGLPLGAFRQF